MAFIGLSEMSDALDNMNEFHILEERRKYKHKTPKNAKKYSINSFMWSDTEYTPRQLLDQFQHLTPFLITTTQGYFGRDESMNTIGHDEVYWVKGVVKVRRLVLKNAKNSYYSVPITDKLQIQPYHQGQPVGPPTNLKRFCDEGPHGGFTFLDEGHLKVFQDAGDGQRLDLGILRIIDQYDERHLITHSLIAGRIYHESCIIPIYMPITMAIAVGMDTNDHKHFYTAMLDMYNSINQVPEAVSFPRGIHACNEIMIYQQKPPEGEYDYLDYVTLAPPTGNKTQDVYESITPGETDVRMTSGSEGGTEKYLDQRGGARGPGSAIYLMTKANYNIADVEPRDALEELVQVLVTNRIPPKSSVRMEIISVYKEVETKQRRPSCPSVDPTYSEIREHDSGPPVAPRRVKKPPPPLPDQAASPSNHDKQQSRMQALLSKFGKPPKGNKKNENKINQISAPEQTQAVPQPALQTGTLTQGKKPPPLLPPKNQRISSQSQHHVTRDASTFIQSVSDIPRDLSVLNTESLGQCLVIMNLSKHIKKFQEAQIDGSLLMELDESILQDEFGFSGFEAKKLRKFANGWRPEAQQSNS